MTAKATDWKIKPAPELRVDLGYEAHFDDAQAEKIREGLIPRQMEDKWFIYADAGWIYLHRSWTGVLIYALRLDASPAGVRVVESWVNRDPEQYRETDLDYDRALLDFLLRTQLLGESAEFPVRAKDKGYPAGVLQHHVVGQAHPEGEFSPGNTMSLWRRLRHWLSKK